MGILLVNVWQNGVTLARDVTEDIQDDKWLMHTTPANEQVLNGENKVSNHNVD